ncbi:MAG: glycosyltransferase [Bacteroidaceae bacterium]|nr:glycosyltransferase [Bacteroidaceae bacterium]
MKILFVGEYSNVHWTLAEGLRALGHDVTVVSDGDRWKNYPRNIDLRRRSLNMTGSIRYLFDLARVWPQLKGYDVVQLINPVFIDLRAERIWPFYRFLRRHNGRVFLGAFGIDYYWVKVGMDCKTFRYSDFNIGSALRHNPENDEMIRDWLHGPKGDLNRRIAADVDGIFTGLYEYEMCYRPFFPEKTRFIPFPIDRSTVTPTQTLSVPYVATKSQPPSSLNCFIGIQRSRSAYKGTDIMLSALQRLQADFGPQRLQIFKAESVPFAQYQEMMNTSHVLLDQLYSYTPAMNALLAMAKGLIVVGGAEEEQYQLLGENELRPIINVQPTEQDVYEQMARRLLSGQEDIHQLQLDSIEYIRRHHDHIHVARQYEIFYQQ